MKICQDVCLFARTPHTPPPHAPVNPHGPYVATLPSSHPAVNKDAKEHRHTPRIERDQKPPITTPTPTRDERLVCRRENTELPKQGVGARIITTDK